MSRRPLTFIDVCAGMGGISLGLEAAGMICKGQVEIDDYCNRILQKHWPDVPRWGDLTTLDPAILPAVDLVAGGYPCQPFSLSGQRRGAADHRHLWPYLRALVAALRPSWCLFENVAGHVSLGLDKVLSDLESLQYACGTTVIPACACDAPHIRYRIWILAHTEHARGRESQSPGHDTDGAAGQRPKEAGGPGASSTDGGAGILADPDRVHGNPAGHGASPLLLRGLQERGACGGLPGSGTAQPGLAGGHDGLSARLESLRAAWQDGTWEQGVPRTVTSGHIANRRKRAKACGNAVVPYIPMIIGRCIVAAHWGSP